MENNIDIRKEMMTLYHKKLKELFDDLVDSIKRRKEEQEITNKINKIMLLLNFHEMLEKQMMISYFKENFEKKENAKLIHEESEKINKNIYNIVHNLEKNNYNKEEKKEQYNIITKWSKCSIEHMITEEILFPELFKK